MNQQDPDLQTLVATFRQRDPRGQEFGQVFRHSFDQAYDGQNTGRFRPEELSKTELAHIGSLVEINIRRQFADIIEDGLDMDFLIAGLEVDCKFSKMPFGWMIPIETLGNFAMLCHANELTANYRVGFVRVDDGILTQGGNRDRKRTIKKSGRESIDWLWYDEPYPRNVLLHLSPQMVDFVFDESSGQRRINNLFRAVQQEIIPRSVICTVAQQKDPMKRVRYNGGARSALLPEGILILGDYSRHTRIARDLNIPIPGDGECVAVRVVPAEQDYEGPSSSIGETLWRVAKGDDPVIDAPVVPEK